LAEIWEAKPVFVVSTSGLRRELLRVLYVESGGVLSGVDSPPTQVLLLIAWEEA